MIEIISAAAVQYSSLRIEAFPEKGEVVYRRQGDEGNDYVFLSLGGEVFILSFNGLYHVNIVEEGEEEQTELLISLTEIAHKLLRSEYKNKQSKSLFGRQTKKIEVRDKASELYVLKESGRWSGFGLATYKINDYLLGRYLGRECLLPRI